MSTIQQQNIFMIKFFIKTSYYIFNIYRYRFNRTTIIGDENISNVNSFILVTWHGKCLGVMEHFRQRGYHVLISQSRDGDIISNISKKFGYNLFRGSSNRGGKEAMKKCINSFH